MRVAGQFECANKAPRLANFPRIETSTLRTPQIVLVSILHHHLDILA